MEPESHPQNSFEVILRVAPVDGESQIPDQVRALIDAGVDQVADPALTVEHWEPTPVKNAITRLFFTSVGIATVTRSSLSRIADVLNEAATALDGTAGLEQVTIQIGDDTIPLADVTREMIETWLPVQA